MLHPLPASASSSPSPIGLVGLGLIGTAIAERLLGADLSVLGWDIDPERRAALQARGAGVAQSGNEIFSRCRRIVLSLPSHREVAEVIAMAGPALTGGMTLIDTTTGDPALTEELARGLCARGVNYLDATISGSSAQVRAGTVALMVGGDAECFAACGDLFRCIAQEAFHTGPAGTGARMKLVTNLVLGLNRAALAEGLALARSLDLGAALTLAVMRGSAAYSRIMDTKGPRMIQGDFTPDARLSQHLKDVRLILESGRKAGLSLPLSTAHRALLERAEAAGYGELDNSAIIKVLTAPEENGKDG